MFVKNEKGIALVTALMFTMITLGIVMMLLYMVTQASKITAANKKYKTALEASYGAVDLIAQDILPKILNPSFPFSASDYADVSLLLPDSACLNEKMKKPTSLWNSAVCNANTKMVDANIKSDFTFNLKATNDPVGYKMYAKIVDTKCTAALPACTNSQDPATTKDPAYNATIKGLVVADAVIGGGGPQEIQPKPAYYTIEVQGERALNPHEKSKLSVLYAY